MKIGGKLLEWHSKKHDCAIAHAVDPDAKQRTGVPRTICGATIPDDAQAGGARTKRCECCVRYLKLRAAREARESA